MDRCGDIPSSLHRTHYVSWCVDSSPASPPLVTSAGKLSIDPVHIPLLPLSGSKPPGGLKGASLSRQPPRGLRFPRRSAFRTSTRTLPDAASTQGTARPTADPGRQRPDNPHNDHDSGDEDEDDKDEEEHQGSVSPQGGLSLLHPEDDTTVLLPKSSAVVSWHEGDTNSPPTDALTPNGVEDHCAPPPTAQEDHLPPAAQEAKKPCCISLTSNQSRFLPGRLHLPFGGQQRLAEERRGAESRHGCSSEAHARPVPSNKAKRSSDIIHCPMDIFKTSCELEKENAHFIVVDMVLEVLEGVKWTLSLSQCSSVATDTHQHTQSSVATDTHQHTQSSAVAAVQMREHTHRCAEDTTHVHRDTQVSGTDVRKHAQNSREDAHMCQQHTGTKGTHIHRQEEDTRQHTHQFPEGILWAKDNRQGAVVNARTHSRNEEEVEEEEEEELGKEPNTLQPKTLSVVSTDSGFEDCGGNVLISRSSLRHSLRSLSSSLRSPMVHSGVEHLAQQLVSAFRTSWFPSQKQHGGRCSLRTSLQELPGTDGAVAGGNRVSLTEEIRQRTRMRGTLYWAPPRFQIIFTVQPAHRRSELVPSQHFLCAGCGTPTEPRYIKKLRYCEYMGRYFCDGCHGGSESLIPGRVLTHWDFSRYPVSDFSKQLLVSVWQQPLFDLTCVGKTLYGRVRELVKFKELQEQLLGIKKLLTACRLSQGVMSEFERLPAHLTEQSQVFSMEDLLKLKRGQLVPLVRAVLHSAEAHVHSCQLCLARGFICELCRESDILFPFQKHICRRCTVCKACFHKDCFRDEGCPKCARIQSRRQLLREASW